MEERLGRLQLIAVGSTSVRCEEVVGILQYIEVDSFSVWRRRSAYCNISKWTMYQWGRGTRSADSNISRLTAHKRGAEGEVIISKLQHIEVDSTSMRKVGRGGR